MPSPSDILRCVFWAFCRRRISGDGVAVDPLLLPDFYASEYRAQEDSELDEDDDQTESQENCVAFGVPLVQKIAARLKAKIMGNR